MAQNPSIHSPEKWAEIGANLEMLAAMTPQEREDHFVKLHGPVTDRHIAPGTKNSPGAIPVRHHADGTIMIDDSGR